MPSISRLPTRLDLSNRKTVFVLDEKNTHLQRDIQGMNADLIIINKESFKNEDFRKKIQHLIPCLKEGGKVVYI